MSRRVARAAGEVALTVLSVLGGLCIVLVIAAVVFDVTLMMFKTGSMSPTIPAGSVAVVREIPADQVQVGDVVTVDRPGQLPITHRVTSVQSATDPAERVITMKGDANDQPDPAPYTVATVRIVMFSVPGAARVITTMSNPYVLGGITIGVTLLVTWAFWPRSGRSTRRPGSGGDEAAGGNGDDPASDPRPRRAITMLVVLIVGTSFVVALTVEPEPAAASEIKVVRGDHLTLTSISDPGIGSMTPGSAVHWQVGVSADAVEPGTVTVSLSGTGDSSLELGAAVGVCSQQWVDGTCPGLSWDLAGFDSLPLDGNERNLLDWTSEEERWFLFTVTMPEDAMPTPGGSVSQVVHAVGQGDAISVGDDSIADTGVPDLRLPLGLAVLAIVGGILLARIGAIRRPLEPQSSVTQSSEPHSSRQGTDVGGQM